VCFTNSWAGLIRELRGGGLFFQRRIHAIFWGATPKRAFFTQEGPLREVIFWEKKGRGCILRGGKNLRLLGCNNEVLGGPSVLEIFAGNNLSYARVCGVKRLLLGSLTERRFLLLRSKGGPHVDKSDMNLVERGLLKNPPFGGIISVN